MSFRKLMGRLLLYVVLEIAVVSGVRISPEEIEKILNVMHRTRVEYVVKKDDPGS